MKAAVLYAKDDIRIEEIEVPELKPNEVLVKVKATGICGSDLPRVLGNAAHYYPIVLGHEFSGVVEKVGTNVTKVKEGDRIAGAPLLPCHDCPDCLRGDYALCNNYSFIGSRVNGSWAEYVKIPEKNAVKVPDNVSFEEAALFEPSAVALHALKLIGFAGGENVAILGGGNIGLLSLQWAKILGARFITVFDLDDERLETAQQLGADFTINTTTSDFREAVNEITGGKGFEVVLETAGSTTTMKMSFELAGKKAKICFVGTPTQNITFPFPLFEQMNRKEFTLTGSWMSYSAPFPGREWELTSHFVEKKQLNLKDIVYRTMPLEEIRQVFEWYKKPGFVKGKILLIPA